VWVKNSDRAQILRLDPATANGDLGSFKDPDTGKTITSYGIPADAANNLYLLDFSSSNIGRLDARSGELTVFKGKIANSRPRRGRFDAQGRLWFAEYAGNAIGMLDPKAGKVQEWVLPTAWSQPYDVITDRNGEAWNRLDAERPGVRGSIPRAARSSSICCAAHQYSAASSSTTPPPR